MEAMPGSPLEVVEAEFFLELLMGLFADPSRLDRGGKRLEGGVRRQVGKVVFALAEARRSPMSQASSPGMCCAPLSWMRCGGPSATRTRTAAKEAAKAALGSPTPSEQSPGRTREHCLRRYRLAVRDVPLSRRPVGDRKHQRYKGAGVRFGCVGVQPLQQAVKGDEAVRRSKMRSKRARNSLRRRRVGSSR